MQNKKQEIKKPINGYFENLEDLKHYHQMKTKQQKESTIQKIPIAFSHLTHKKNERVQLLYAKPQMKMGFILNNLSRKAIQNEKARQHEGVYIFLKHNKKLLHISDEETVLQKYEQFKDTNNLLCICYQLHSQCIGCPLDGYQIAALFLIIPLALPVIATVKAFDWTAKQIKDINVQVKNIKIPTIKMPTFGPKQHHFKFKQTFSLQQRKLKVQQFKLNYPTQIVTIIERHERSILPELPYCKFGIESQMIFRNFCIMMQTRISKYFGQQTSQSKHSFFFVIGGKIPHHDHTMEAIYNKFKEDDGLLYVTYQEQESF